MIQKPKAPPATHCHYCHQPADCRTLEPYLVTDGNGVMRYRWLHPHPVNGNPQSCAELWHFRFRWWKKTGAAEAAPDIFAEPEPDEDTKVGY